MYVRLKTSKKAKHPTIQIARGMRVGKKVKQNASLNKSPTKVIRSQKNHIFASIIAFCKLEFLKWKTNLNHFALKYKLIIAANRIAFHELRKFKNKKFMCVR